MAAETCFFSSVFFIQSSGLVVAGLRPSIVSEFGWAAFHSLLAGLGLRCRALPQLGHRRSRMIFAVAIFVAAFWFSHIVVLGHEWFPNLLKAVRDASPGCSRLRCNTKLPFDCNKSPCLSFVQPTYTVPSS